MSGVYGDTNICSNIKDPFFCVKQTVCGWCGQVNGCISGDKNHPYVPCDMDTYTFHASEGYIKIFNIEINIFLIFNILKI